MSTAVVVARTHRDVVTLTGPETETYLQGQLSQDVVAMEVGDVVRRGLTGMKKALGEEFS